MDQETIQIDIDQRGVAQLTLNNPAKHNAFDDQIISDLTRHLQTVNNDSKVRVLILAAKGRSFSAGADANWMKRMAGYSYQQNVIDAENLAKMLNKLNTMSKPTIARVQGAAYGGGVGLVACCDIAIASERASFCLSEVKLGLAPATISPYVIEAMGARAARRYFLTAERFDATTARDLGLVSECVPEDQLDIRIDLIVSSILRNGPSAIADTKQLIREVKDRPVDSALMRQTSELIATIRCSAEGQEGLDAFLKKRSPSWGESSKMQSE